MQGVVYLLRHGETDWNREGRFQGHTNTPLNARGVAQAVAARQALSNLGIRRVVSSDLMRAHHTALILGAALGLPVEQDPALRERSYGIFEGLTWQQIAQQHPAHHEAYHHNPLHPIPGAEPTPDLRTRAWNVLQRHAPSAAQPLPVLLVSHGGLLRAMLWHALGDAAPKPIENARPYRVVWDGQRVVDVTAL